VISDIPILPLSALNPRNFRRKSRKPEKILRPMPNLPTGKKKWAWAGL
jgi:hypothetical protein